MGLNVGRPVDLGNARTDGACLVPRPPLAPCGLPADLSVVAGRCESAPAVATPPPNGTYRRLLRSLRPYRATAAAAMGASSVAAAAAALYAYLIGPLLKAVLTSGP